VSLDFDPGAPVPILIASRGPRVLSLAGEIADAAMIEGLFTPDALDWALARIAAGTATAGRPAATVDTVAWQALFLGDADLAEQPALKRWAALLISTTRPAVLERIGVSEESIHAVSQAAVATGGAGEPGGAGVRAEDVSKLLLVGSPAQVLERIEALRERGVSAVAGTLFGGPDEIAPAMRRFAREVIAPARA
jgi:alkanesulfonate monooxygenase SsuD/methylene tetrahydromethanopterin reductase-like flavin-dependent oxidoreductase (luciferase family)